MERNIYKIGKELFITNLEEIKKNDYALALDTNIVFKVSESDLLGIKKFPHFFYKKIILTTDPDLIKDGVQKIDDEFLEWLCKNPSCEEVEVEKYHGINTSIAEISCISGNDDYNWQGRSDLRDYKIIIPSEEPKTNLEKLPFPELVKEFAEYYKNVPLGEEPKQENCCTPIGQIKRYVDCIECDAKSKQENNLNINELSNKLDNALSNETTESLTEFIENKRKIDTCINFDIEIGCKFLDCPCEKEEILSDAKKRAKQETIEESQNLKNFKKLVTDEISPALKNIIKEKQETLESLTTEEITEMVFCNKKETLEEALNEFVKTMLLDQSVYIDFLQCAEFGAKWQAEQDKNKYSEEDFKLFARQYFREIKMDKSNLLWEDLADKCLEQFKKK